MTRGIFLVGNESALARAVETEVQKRVERFAVSFIPNRFSGGAGALSAASPDAVSKPENEKRVLLDWNPSSPVSTRALVLAAENRLDKIDEAILVCSPPLVRRGITALSLADIEILVNDHIKGWFFLVRELAALFTSRKSGTLALIYSDTDLPGKDDIAALLGHSSLASFRALTQSLLAAAAGEPYITMGFSCSEAGGEDGFTSFLFKHLDEGNKRNKGKLFKFGKFNFFGR